MSGASKAAATNRTRMADPEYARITALMDEATTWPALREAQRMIFDAECTDQLRGWLWDSACAANDRMSKRRGWRPKALGEVA